MKIRKILHSRRSNEKAGGTVVPVAVAASLKCFWHFRREVADENAVTDVDAFAVMIIIIIGSTPPQISKLPHTRRPPAPPHGQQCMDEFRSNFPSRQTTNFLASFDILQRVWAIRSGPDCWCCI